MLQQRQSKNLRSDASIAHLPGVWHRQRMVAWNILKTKGGLRPSFHQLGEFTGPDQRLFGYERVLHGAVSSNRGSSKSPTTVRCSWMKSSELPDGTGEAASDQDGEIEKSAGPVTCRSASVVAAEQRPPERGE
jgi:hypothetical protein